MRRRAGACPNVGSVQTECRSKFSLSHEDTTSYLPGWKRVNATATQLRGDDDDEEEEDRESPLTVAWQYQSWRQLRGVPFVGNLALYPGGGYSAELGVNYEASCVLKS